MRKPSTRKITTSATTVSAKPVKPAKLAAAAPAAIVAVEPATLPAVVEPTPAAVPAAAKPSAHITRTAATIVRSATNFAVLSDRDTAYLSFYAGLIHRAGGAAITLADIHGSGERPSYAGSNKPHDAGVIVRLTKAGLIQPSADGHGFTLTDAARTHRAVTTAA